MPGVFGLITRMPRELAEPQLMRMLKALQHESFYTGGTWINESLGVYVGWMVPKGSFADGMPLHNECRDVTLVFSGEEFPEPGIRTALRELGHEVPAEGPSYLVHRYEAEPEFPKGLNGRFHGLVADRQRGTLMLFNDRYGLQRLYYHEAKDAFYFAAEAKAILKVRPELREVDTRGLGEFLSCGCVLENRTLFPKIQVLPPGSKWVFRGGLVEKKAAFFEPREWEEQQALEPESYYAQLRDVLVRNLSRYFNGNERVGVSLTGGLDTRILMAWRKPAAGSLPCYTFGSMYRDNEDVKLARKVARLCSQSHEIITTGDEFLSRFSHYAERTIYLTDACVDLGRSPDLYVNEKARQIAPVRIVGTYGSEMLLHAIMFKADQPAQGLFNPEIFSRVRDAQDTYRRIQQVHPVTFIAFRQSPWHHYGVLGLEQTQVGIRAPYLDNDLVKVVYQAPFSVTVNEAVRMRLIREGNSSLGRLRTDRAAGKFFSHLALEFLFKAEYAYDYGMPQWMAEVDHWFGPLHLERIWLGRHKVFHFRVWYRDQLANYVREMLLDSRSLKRPYLNPSAVRSIVNGHLKGNRNYTTEIHRLLTLELTHRLFLDSSVN